MEGSESAAFFDSLIGTSVEAGAKVAQIARWKDTRMFQSVTHKNGVINLTKFLASLNNADVNTDMQAFYVAVKRYANEPDQSELPTLLNDAKNMAVDILVTLKADLKQTCDGFFAGRDGETITMPGTEPEVLPPLPDLLGGGLSRRQFLDAHFRREVRWSER
jgi:hypothetical protein